MKNYTVRYVMENNHFVLRKIKIFCKNGHYMKGKNEPPGKQWCKKCTKINQKRLREFGNE